MVTNFNFKLDGWLPLQHLVGSFRFSDGCAFSRMYELSVIYLESLFRFQLLYTWLVSIMDG